jgi:Tol biopolymer transport system component
MGGYSNNTLLLTVGSGRATWTGKRIAVVPIPQGQLTYLTEATESAFSPSWSPDGRLIAYVSAPDIGHIGGGFEALVGAGRRRIWVMNADGSEMRNLTDDEAYRDERPLWSADGSHILFGRVNGEHVSLWLMPSSRGQAQQVAELSRPGAATPVFWFGYYGHINWDAYFDWWRSGG